ncbi:HNH endonuclease [Burkholderia ambifaria]|uniref:HNH endonuclease n=1 Tax=Burkholderia ambifaria TaxID=152480 RepID=UPI00158CF9FA|nr:HNH endonuclease [Burkholderia ambifaria]
MTKIIRTKRGQEILVDDEDFESLNQHSWHVDAYGYAVRNAEHPLDPSKRWKERMHRTIAGLEFGDTRVPDHINGNKLDNRRANLRVCLQAENMRNAKKRVDNTSGFKGVTYHRASGLWHARIYANCKVVSLGYFQHRENAYEAYRAAAAELHGQFANYGT